MSIEEKISKKMEESMTKNMTGESKEQYEKEEAERLEKEKDTTLAKEQKKEKEQNITFNITSSDLKDINAMMIKFNLVDSNQDWLGGYLNFKSNTNAVFENLFQKKKLRFLTKVNENYYLLKIVKNVLSVYKSFTKNDVATVQTGIKILSKSIRIDFKDGDNYSVDVTANRNMVKRFKELLK